jgi:hypothetical protein
MDYEQQEILSRRISEHLSARTQQKFEGIDRLMVETAELLTIRFPSLLLTENRNALLMAVELRFEEFRDAILRDEYERREAAFDELKEENYSRGKLIALGLLPTPVDDMPWD